MNARNERLCVVASVSVGNFVLSLRCSGLCALSLNIIIINPAERTLEEFINWKQKLEIAKGLRTEIYILKKGS